MAKDFDFIPAQKPRQRPATQSKPEPRPRPHATAHTKTSAKVTQNTAPAARRVHKTRSSLINYHPLKVAPSPKPVTKAAPSKPKSTVATPSHSAPPYLPPARNIPIPRPQTAPKKRFNKKTVVSVVASFIAVVLLASGLLIPLLENPSVTIILYIVAAIIFKLNSKVSFSIALLLLLAIPVLLVIRNGALAGTYAIFCFYFLVVGVISATIELRKSDS